MQAIAAEMNLSETAFVSSSSSSEADYELRIFTPNRELPFAGHPSVGTAFVLYEEGRFGKKASKFTVRQQVKIGLLPIEIDPTADGVRVMATSGRPERGNACEDVEAAVSALGLRMGDVTGTGLPVEASSTGLQQMMVPVVSLDAVRTMKPDMRAVTDLERAMGITGFAAFVLSSHGDANVHMRFFTPASGIAEDPATGSAAGALGAYLVRHGAVDVSEETVRLVIEQGEEVRRPSRIEVEVEHEGGEPKVVRIGGASVTLMKGQILA